jgi:hypothetical protein
MPPDLDIYVLTHHRNEKTINRFIENFVDRSASEDRGTEELMIVRLEAKETANPYHGDDFEWKPALTLSHIIQYGLSDPPRAFCTYHKSKYHDITQTMIAFTTDNQVVFGLSIDDEGMKPENLSRARNLLQTLAENYEGHVGLIAVEQPPELSEISFRRAKDHQLTVYFAEYA